MVWSENTHLLCKGKYHCMAELLFVLFAYAELVTYCHVWLSPNQSNRRSAEQWDTSPYKVGMLNLKSSKCMDLSVRTWEAGWKKTNLKSWDQQTFLSTTAANFFIYYFFSEKSNFWQPKLENGNGFSMLACSNVTSKTFIPLGDCSLRMIPLSQLTL